MRSLLFSTFSLCLRQVRLYIISVRKLRVFSFFFFFSLVPTFQCAWIVILSLDSYLIYRSERPLKLGTARALQKLLSCFLPLSSQMKIMCRRLFCLAGFIVLWMSQPTESSSCHGNITPNGRAENHSASQDVAVGDAVDVSTHQTPRQNPGISKIDDSSSSAHCEMETGSDPISSQPPVPGEVPWAVAELIQYGTPLDRFHCGDCVCINVSREATLVDCDYEHTRKSQHTIPDWLPGSSQSIDLTGNNIKELTSHNLSHYPALLALNVSNNALAYVDRPLQGLARFQCPVVTLDISKNPIKTIADFSFQFFPDLINLYVAHSALREIKNFTFFGLDKLEVLDISYGRIKSIEVGAFEWLRSLRSLALNHNTAFSYLKFSQELFLPLQNLSTLDVAGVSDGTTLDCNVLRSMPKLKALYMDGNKRTRFGEACRDLSELDTLHFGTGGFCSLTTIPKELFKNLIHLKKIVIDHCKLQRIDPHAFEPLKTLKEFMLVAPTHLEVHTAFDIIPLLNNATIRSLSFQRFHDSGGYHTILIGRNDSHLFQRFSQLEVLKLEHLHITFVEPGFVTRLPQSLKYLSFKGNRLHLVNLLHSVCLSGRLPHLEKLELSDQTNQYHEPRPVVITNATYLCPLKMWLLAHRYFFQVTLLEFGAVPTGLVSSSRESTNTPRLCLPIFSANNAFRLGISLLNSDDNNVEEMYSANAYLQDFGKYRLASTLAVADLSGNNCEQISMKFLRPENQMQVISLRRNFLGNALRKDRKGNVFARAIHVTYLDLSHNSVSRIPYKVFGRMNRTKVLVLADNQMQEIDMKLSHMTGLKFLDVRRNSVSWISRRSRDDLDTLAMTHHVTLGLEDNALQCTCGGLELLAWLAFTNVNILDREFLTCLDQNQRVIPVGDAEVRFLQLRRMCVSHAYVAAVSASCLAVMLVIIAAALVVRNRWRLLYWRNTILVKYYGMQQPEEERTHHKFDAYLVYSEDAEHFVMDECYRELQERGHKVCIEAKDFLPGSFIPCNIVSAVKSSTFTMPVISDGNHHNEWFEYSLQMALLESAQSGREVLHLLLFEPIPDERLSPDVLRLMHRDAFSELPPPDCPAQVRRVFWDTLSRTIGHTAHPDEFPRLELQH